MSSLLETPVEIERGFDSIVRRDGQMSEFEIREATCNDRERVIALVSKMWSEDVTSRYEWLYLSNPHGRALTWIAIERDTGEAVGCTSIFPRKALVDGRERMGAIGGDCYIEPRVRRRGLATALHRVSLSGMRERGVDFMYGPPNPNNLAALLKAGSTVVTSFKRWARPLNGRALYRAAFARVPSRFEARLADLPLKMFTRLTRASGREITLERVANFGGEFDALFARFAASRSVVCVRDSDYLNWRYLAAPVRRQIPFAIKQRGELAGFVALEMKCEQAAVVDFFTQEDQKLLDAALQAVMEQAAAEGCCGLNICCTPGSLIAPRLRRMGFIARIEHGFQVAAANCDPQIDALLSAGAWHFMAADEDMDTDFSEPPE